jgi:predicted O-methyltransferase YrrM
VVTTDRSAAVDRYLSALLPPDPALDEALRASAAAGLPPHDVAPNQGAFLHLLARIAKAKAILEIGTLGGYSTIWLARALPPDGRLVTLEVDPAYAEVARDNLARAGFAEQVDVKAGPALETLATLEGPFDLIFLDADKQSSADYLRAALPLSRPGTVILADNVVRGGAILDGDSDDPRVQGVRRFYELLAAEPSLRATALQTVGSKGWDGFALAVVSEPPA